MIDINIIRTQPELIVKALENRGDDKTLVDQVLEADAERKKIIIELEGLQQQRNQKTQAIKICADPAERAALIEDVKNSKDRLAELTISLNEIEEKRDHFMASIPNIPSAEVPVGLSEEENEVYKIGLEKRTFDFEPLPHWDIPASKPLIEFERGVKLSGSRFYVLRGQLAQLQRGLIAYLLDSHRQAGYEELYLPHIVRGVNVFNSGQLPKFKSNLYKDYEEDFWLIPTAEVPITSFHSNEYVDGKLPLNYCSYTPCFRREKMSAGKDVRGMKRGHQFDKVELYKFVAPETSANELNAMVSYTEKICRELELPYRILKLCTGDLGFASTITYDIEVWAPGCDEWLEVSSVSNCTDFQARRSNIRIKNEDGKGSQYVHTLNGSAFGIPRTMIAIMENNQLADGRIKVPEALVPFVRLEYIEVE